MRKLLGLTDRIGRYDYFICLFVLGLANLGVLFLFKVLFLRASAMLENNASFATPTLSLLLVGMALWLILSAWALVDMSIGRLHDIGQSGWPSIALFVPVLNFALVLFLMGHPGNYGANDYGWPADNITPAGV